VSLGRRDSAVQQYRRQVNALHEQARHQLVLAIQVLQTQLADRNRVDAQGRRLGERAYWRWRTETQAVLTAKLAELRDVKAWIHDHRRHDDTALSLLRRLHRHLTTKPIALDDETLAVVTDAGVYLQQHA